jgi:hypothetical protein
MKIAVSAALCITLLVSLLSASANNFPKGIKYLGGPGFPDNKQIKDSWDNSLDITDKEVILGFKKNLIPKETIPASSVKRITYGQATTRRIGQWIAIGVLLAPVAILGVLHKSRQHRVLLEWTDDQQRERGMLMQIDKDYFVGVLNDLAFRTGKPVYADQDDKDWLFKSGVKAELDPTPREAAKEPKKK